MEPGNFICSIKKKFSPPHFISSVFDKQTNKQKKNIHLKNHQSVSQSVRTAVSQAVICRIYGRSKEVPLPTAILR